MKKYLIIASAALIALASCNKELQDTPEVVNQDDIILTFTSAKPGLSDEVGTKTAWDNTTSSIVWTTNDKIRVAYTLDGDWMGKDAATGDNSAKFYASDAVAIDGSDSSVGTFNVPVGSSSFTDPAASGDYVFYALYPSTAASATIDDVEALAVTIPSEQTPEANSFQGSADFLVGKTKTLTLSGIPTNPIEIDWTRLVAHADLTFSNIAFDGVETINSIILTANSDAKLTGDITIDLAAGTASEGSSNKITINGTNLSASGNSVEAWVCVLPVTFTSLDVEIQTNKAKYTREITGISKTFKKNARNRLTINMSTAVRTADTPDEYSEYTSALAEGDYVVYYSGYALKAAVSSNRMQNESVTPTNGVIATNDASIVWHIAPSATNGYYTFYNANTGKYLAATNTNNQAQLIDDNTDDKALFSVTLTDGKFDFVNKSNDRYLRQNGTSGWAMYANTTGNLLTLYYKDNRTAFDAPATVSAAINGSDDSVVDVTFETVSGAASYGIVATPTSGDPVVKTGVTSSPATISVADGLAYDTEYTIAVYAVPSNTVTYKNSAATSASGTVTTGSAPLGYALVSSTADVTTGLYVIAAKKNGSYYAMSKTFATKIDGTEVTTNSFISETDAASYVVTITKGASTYTITSDSQTLGYSSGTNFTTSGTGTTAWVLSAGTNGTFRFTISGGSRVVAFNGTQFGAYASTNVTSGSTSYYDVELFKYTGVVKSDPETTVTPASPIALTVDGTQQLTVDTNSDGAITYDSDDESIATVSNTGLITAIAAGTAHITVSIAATGNYNADEKVITVNVSDGSDTPIEITFTSSSSTGDSGNITVSAEKGDGQNAPAYTSDELRLYASNTITISSSTNNIAKIELLFHKQGSKAYIESVTADSGTYTGGGTSTGSSDTKTDTWTGDTNTVVFTMGSSGQRVLEKVKVYYK